METNNKSCPYLKRGTIEVPEVLKECLLSLTAVREKIEAYYPKSDVSESIDQYAANIDDLIGDAVFQLGEMIRLEVVNIYYYKESNPKMESPK